MKLFFKGKLETGDDCRVSDDICGAVHVGGRDVIAEVSNATWSGPVTVAFADKRFEGALAVSIGWGYSEWTPMESDELMCGPHDLIAELSSLEGEEVRLWIADEPINVLEDAP